MLGYTRTVYFLIKFTSFYLPKSLSWCTCNLPYCFSYLTWCMLFFDLTPFWGDFVGVGICRSPRYSGCHLHLGPTVHATLDNGSGGRFLSRSAIPPPWQIPSSTWLLNHETGAIYICVCVCVGVFVEVCVCVRANYIYIYVCVGLCNFYMNLCLCVHHCVQNKTLSKYK